jgi:single-strand DNA-binding protein
MYEIPIHTVGRLAADPERFYRRDGMAVTRVAVEVQERRQTPEGWRRTGTTRLECRAWGGLAEHIHASLGLGDRVVIFGRLRQRPLEGGGSTYDVVLDDLGPSLVFTNAWLIPPDEAGGSGGVTVCPTDAVVSQSDGHAGAVVDARESSQIEGEAGR